MVIVHSLSDPTNRYQLGFDTNYDHSSVFSKNTLDQLTIISRRFFRLRVRAQSGYLCTT